MLYLGFNFAQVYLLHHPTKIEIINNVEKEFFIYQKVCVGVDACMCVHVCMSVCVGVGGWG